MDEDEIEMLQEARARLANTQGKKAKRKQRERMLGDAKRLADLQKRRELKQAGLLSGRARTRSRKRQREVDYATEIPFHKPAPAGFHDVSVEREKQEDIRKKRLKDIDYKKVNEENYRSRDKEEAAARKKEEQRLRNLERANLQLVINQVAEKSDPVSQRKRGVLSLPEPMVNDAELSEVAKLAADASGKNAMLPPPNRSAPTNALLSDYSDRPLPTPMRTPQTVAGSITTRETLLREASNLKILSEGQTPLLGGENKELGAGLTSMDMVENNGLTPRIGSAATIKEDPTPMRSSAPSQTPLRRDALGLNPHQEFNDTASFSTFGATSFATSSKSMREVAREERRALRKARIELAAALSSLPTPQYEYDLAVPEAPTDDGNEAKSFELVKDAADIEAEEQLRLEKEAAALYESRSSVVKRMELPRPLGIIDDESLPLIYGTSQDTAEREALTMLRAEALKLMRHDAHAHPLAVDDVLANPLGKKSKKKKKKTTKSLIAPEAPLDHIPAEVLDLSKDILLKEMDSIHYKDDTSVKLNLDASTGGCIQLCFGNDGWRDSPPQSEMKDNDIKNKVQVQALKDSTRILRKKADKLSANIAIKLGGYIKRSETLNEERLKTFHEINHASVEEYVYTKLMSAEMEAIPSRKAVLENDIKFLEEEETQAQKQYGRLMLEKNRILALIKKESN